MDIQKSVDQLFTVLNNIPDWPKLAGVEECSAFEQQKQRVKEEGRSFEIQHVVCIVDVNECMC